MGLCLPLIHQAHTYMATRKPKSRPKTSRRQFLSAAVAGAAVALGTPLVLTARKTDSKLVVGEGEYKYEVLHDWPALPDKFTWQTTHNVAVDKAGCLYVIHEG